MIKHEIEKHKLYLIGLVHNMFLARCDCDVKLVAVCLGSVRGYVHALRLLGIVTPSSCYRLCALPLDEMSEKQASREIIKYLDAGFGDMQTCSFNATDYALGVIESMEASEAALRFA